MSKKNKNKRKNKGFKAGLITGGIIALLYSAVFPLFRISDFLLCGGFAILLGKIVSIMASGLDLTTHNKQDAKKAANDVEELPLSGDETADAVIAKGQEMLHQIRAENDAIPDAVLSGQMDELERLCVQIFKTVAEKPMKASQIRKFMNYYLPTTLKMLASYRTMEQRGVSAADMAEARSTLIRGMGMVLTACQKQLDNLYKDTMLDVTTDIDVLEQMLKRDGFTEGELGTAHTKAPTATSAQMQQGTPVINTPKSDDDFVSFYSNRNVQKK
ncbi:MAG: 5-bromo-4-chloroindolyl phosphate hydrolysis family protein [Clostridia bacterium]|nr:5-bromo-4-chloroindolyl phosphate hydrolysis family protein [Clostridia bacterium]